MTDTFFIILVFLRVNNQARSGELFYYLSSAALSMPSSSSNLGYGLPMTTCSSNQILLSVKANDFNVCSFFEFLLLPHETPSHPYNLHIPAVSQRYGPPYHVLSLLRLLSVSSSYCSVFCYIQH